MVRLLRNQIETVQDALGSLAGFVRRNSALAG